MDVELHQTPFFRLLRHTHALLYSVNGAAETCRFCPMGLGSSVCPTPAALLPKTVSKVAEGSSAHAQGRLKVPGEEP